MNPPRPCRTNSLFQLKLVAALLLSLFCVGCGDDGKYSVSGEVTYKGEPIPSGEIRFTPNNGNKGPMVLVKIKDGHYETPADKGLVGGDYQKTYVYVKN